MIDSRDMQDRYARRRAFCGRYRPTAPDVTLARVERHWHFCRLLSQLEPLNERRLLEVGAGHGSNILELLSLGFSPGNVTANELQPDRARSCRERVPRMTRVDEGDATRLQYPHGYFDVILFSTVFSSILKRSDRADLASALWKTLKPGGAVLWYDFTWNNPRNPDVRGVPVSEIWSLFQEAAEIRTWRVTLCPPIARVAARLHPLLYQALNLIPFLRMHRVGWIRKAMVSHE